MALRARFENTDEIGVFAKLTNTYCIVGLGGSANFYTLLQQELAKHIPVVYGSIGGTRLVGRMCVGNKNCLLLPITTTDQELQFLRDSLPDSVKVQRVEERLSALGNVICCNDHVALINNEVDKETEMIVQDVLGVETFRTSIAGEALVGTYAVISNKGCLVQPRTARADMDELASILQVPVVAGTVNRGSAVLGGGMIVNDWAAFVGMNTTSTEITVVENCFQLRRGGGTGVLDHLRQSIMEEQGGADAVMSTV